MDAYFYKVRGDGHISIRSEVMDTYFYKVTSDGHLFL